MRAHPRQKATHQPTPREEHLAETLQGEYGSGGSYGAGGGFADDEPGAKAEEEPARDTIPDDARDATPDLHTRQSESSDEYLRDVKRTDQERKAAESKRKRAAR